MCNLTRTAIWLNLVVRLICSIWRRRQSDKLAAKAIWCLSGNQSHVARKLPAPNASDQSQQRGPDQIARLRRAGLGPDWGQIGVCQSGNLAIRRRFCRIAFDWPGIVQATSLRSAATSRKASSIYHAGPPDCFWLAGSVFHYCASARCRASPAIAPATKLTTSADTAPMKLTCLG